jgi:hypothetical protein
VFCDIQDVIADWKRLRRLCPGLEAPPVLTELALYYYAVKRDSPACLAALLDAGCRSEWLCTMAAFNQKHDFLGLAVSRGCPLNPWVLLIAANTGQQPFLEAVYLELEQSKNPWCMNSTDLSRKAAFGAAARGPAGGMEALRASLAHDWRLWHIAEVAASRGHLECLEILQRCKP